MLLANGDNHSSLSEVSERLHRMVLDFERAGLPKVGKEFVTEAHDEEPDIPSHLWSCNEKAPDDKKEGGIKEVVNVPEPS